MRDEFAVHMLNESGKAKAGLLATHFSTLLDSIEKLLGGEQSRELSIVRTKLEEASFFAKKAMARQYENQQ